MDFKKLIQERQACRSFLRKPVEREKLERIVAAGRLAPSACNSQPWKMYVVSGEKAKDVAKCAQDLGMNKFASDAAAFIVVTDAEPVLMRGSERRFAPDHFVKYDVGELVAYLTLAAQDEGLNTCILGWLNAENLKKAVGYPDGEVCNILIAVGYSDAPVREKMRKPMSEIVTYIE